MTKWVDEYTETEDLNQKYRLLRAEMTHLRGQRDNIEFFDIDAVSSDVRRLNDTVSGELIVFVANDFGLPVAYRPESVEVKAQDKIRQAVLQAKYDDTNDDLNDIRRELLREYPSIHKVIVAEYSDEDIRYHLPEGSNETTNFITVREMVGLIDYTTNSFQSNDQSITY